MRHTAAVCELYHNCFPNHLDFGAGRKRKFRRLAVGTIGRAQVALRNAATDIPLNSAPRTSPAPRRRAPTSGLFDAEPLGDFAVEAEARLLHRERVAGARYDDELFVGVGPRGKEMFALSSSPFSLGRS